jgi:hypothetical protein
MKTKTAIQWLVEQVNKDCLNSTFIRPEIIAKALQIEENQHYLSWNYGVLAGLNYDNDNIKGIQFREYFENKYGRKV